MCDESVKFDLCLKFRIRMLVGAHWSKAEVSNSVSVRQNLDLTHLPGSLVNLNTLICWFRCPIRAHSQ